MTKLLWALPFLLSGLLQAESSPVSPHTQANARGPLPVLIFVSQRLFDDEVFLTVARQLELARMAYVVVSQDTAPAVGMDQTILNPEVRLHDVRASDFSAFVLVGGSGIAIFWRDSLLHEKLREFAATGRTVGAVGIASICLANAGILKGMRATTVPERQAVSMLRAGEARYLPNPVVTDGNIVTASTHLQARAFARRLVHLLKQRKAY